jgi:CheY-like chemotaxis protein
MLCVRYQTTAPVNADWTENLSAGGFFVRTERRFQPGEGLAATVSFPGLLEPIPIDGQVAWVRSSSPVTAGGVGVALVDGPGQSRLSHVVVGTELEPETEAVRPFRLLVVDDNERLIRSYERAIERLPGLTRAGVTTMLAADGKHALALVAEHGADLVITDIYMPEIDGYQLIERLRGDAATARIPIIIITGGRSDERKRAEALGVDAFLLKPVLFAPLMETIACLVDYRRLNSDG